MNDSAPPSWTRRWIIQTSIQQCDLARGLRKAGPAATAGLRAGDVLKEMNGQEIAKMRFLSIERTFSEYGANIRLRISRGAESLEASLDVSAKP